MDPLAADILTSAFNGIVVAVEIIRPDITTLRAAVSPRAKILYDLPPRQLNARHVESRRQFKFYEFLGF